MSNDIISLRYAKGLFLSLPKDYLEEVEEQLLAFSDAMDNISFLKKIFADPAFSFEKKLKVLHEISKKYQQNMILNNFLCLLLSKNRIVLIKNIARDFSNLLDKEKNRLRVTIKSASDLSADYVQLIKENLSKTLNKNVISNCVLDKSLLAGVRIETSSMVFDASIKAKLNSLQKNVLKQII